MKIAAKFDGAGQLVCDTIDKMQKRSALEIFYLDIVNRSSKYTHLRYLCT